MNNKWKDAPPIKIFVISCLYGVPFKTRAQPIITAPQTIAKQ